jgi:hypothetical protein
LSLIIEEIGLTCTIIRPLQREFRNYLDIELAGRAWMLTRTWLNSFLSYSAYEAMGARAVPA